MMEEKDIFSCSWDEFEGWIKKRISGDFSWKIRPIDSKQSREFIVESIETAIEDNNGTFPEKGFSLIEKLTEWELKERKKLLHQSLVKDVDEPDEFDETPGQEPQELDGLLEDHNAIKNLADPAKVKEDASLDIEEGS